ncbi:MAG: sigma-54 dependent transcriptional regulator [bacterium]
MPETILIIDDEQKIISSFTSLLEDEGYKVNSAESIENALKLYNKNRYDLILLDLNLPKLSGVDFLKIIKDDPIPPVVLVISGQSDISTALETIRLGAADYLEKPVPPEKLLTSVKSGLLLSQAQKQRLLMVNDLDQSSRIIGESLAIKKLLLTISQAAPNDVSVLIRGENGTGKELVAMRLYLESKRREKPFIKVNCPGIPAPLFESELFGHTKGAFTGAVRDYPGKFVLADGGSIFLDEIGDLPYECQAKLLRVLETGEVEKLGSTDNTVVDVRVICATNRNLEKLIEENKFREDLYYRISVFSINVPSLNERKDDIPLLVGEFLKRYDPSNRLQLSPDAVAYLTTLDYPGNVRQLKNLIERLSITHPGKQIGMNDLAGMTSIDNLSEREAPKSISLGDQLLDFEKHLIKKTLENTQGNISEAARQLNIDRANLSRKISEWGLKS